MQRLALLLVGILFLVVPSIGHSYVTRPRNRVFQYSCRIGGPPEFPVNCPGPCEAPYAANQPSTNVQRGQSLTVEWPRNNHAGGFIRLSWISGNTPETHENFDAAATFYSCHEVGCRADAGAGDDGGDSNPADGSRNPCTLTTTVPTHLTDGRWTMQWAWFGGTGGYLGDYYSCVNFQVAGGSAVTAKQLPVFVGGDVSNPGRNDLCEYWGTNVLHYCYREPCMEICDDNTVPSGHCEYPQANGRPYIRELLAAAPTNVGQCRTYSTNVVTSFNTKGTFVSNINVPDTFNVATMAVTNLNGYTDYLGTFDLYLENPAGSRIMLMNRYDCRGANFVFNFNSSAAAVRWACPPNGGTWRSVDNFAWFNGAAANGNWKLVIDSKEAVNSRVNGWSMRICETAANPATSASPPTNPATSNPPTSAPVNPITLPPTTPDNEPEIAVKITVSLPISPDVLDITTFIYDLVKVLKIPANAIRSVLVDLDQSTSTLTIVQFQIVNALQKDGTRVDPIKAARDLKDKSEANDIAIQSSIMIKGIQVVGTEEPETEESESFIKTTGFTILVVVIGGVVLIAVVALILGCVIYRKKRSPY